jgi:acetylornithine/succinyldiaminopimelate/putrescine aminotransferase
MAALGVIVDRDLSVRASEMGEYLMGRMAQIDAPEIASIRGIGLLVGLEFHSAPIAHRFVARSIEAGVVVNWTLNADRVVRLAPPLTISREECDFAADAMARALAIVRSEPFG